MVFLDANGKVSFYRVAIAVSVILFVAVAGDKIKTFLRDDDADGIYGTAADYKLIREHLLNDTDSIIGRHKPPIWIHLPYEVNARVWESFGSRNTTNLNQTYMHFTVKTIIAHCGRDANICLIDDNSFARLLPDDAVYGGRGAVSSIASLPEPARSFHRTVASLKLIYRYGGMLVPPSFLCWSNLTDLFNNNGRGSGSGSGSGSGAGDRPFVAENTNAGAAAAMSAKTGKRNAAFGLEAAPDVRFFGCRRKRHPIVKDMIDAAQTLLFPAASSAASAASAASFEPRFTGQLEQWCMAAVQSGNMHLLSAEKIGLMNGGRRERRRKVITVDDLFDGGSGDNNIPSMGIWIPSEEILRRQKYQWFASIRVEDILHGDYLLASYFREAAHRSLQLVQENDQTKSIDLTNFAAASKNNDSSIL